MVYSRSSILFILIYVCRQLWAVVNDVFNTPAEPPICVLTADHRDSWAKVRLTSITLRLLYVKGSSAFGQFVNCEQGIFEYY
jgi:hypothetical protein